MARGVKSHPESILPDRESDPQCWGHEETKAILVPPPHSSPLLAWPRPGFVLHSLGRNALNWLASFFNMHFQDHTFVCLFPFFFTPVYANFHEMWQHDPPELLHRGNQVVSPQHFTLNFPIVGKLCLLMEYLQCSIFFLLNINKK